VVAPSTLHLAWDLMGWLTRKPVAVYLDASAYAILRWGAERAKGRGAAVRTFRTHDPASLRRHLERDVGSWQPVLLSDGYCPICGRMAPLREYLALAREFRGVLLVDDTQALGVFGQGPDESRPYGVGGGGSLRWLGITGSEVLTIASLAKGFGTPLAVLCGAAGMVDGFVTASETRVHGSPPALAALHAAERALAINRAVGERLRALLLARVRRFRTGLARSGLRPPASTFPVQSLEVSTRARAHQACRWLHERGISAVPTSDHSGRAAAVTFVITARHTNAEIDALTALLPAALGAMRRRPAESNTCFAEAETHATRTQTLRRQPTASPRRRGARHAAADSAVPPRGDQRVPFMEGRHRAAGRTRADPRQ
jgi:8-amino-7-oxononanoate synthase